MCFAATALDWKILICNTPGEVTSFRIWPGFGRIPDWVVLSNLSSLSLSLYCIEKYWFPVPSDVRMQFSCGLVIKNVGQVFHSSPSSPWFVPSPMSDQMVLLFLSTWTLSPWYKSCYFPVATSYQLSTWLASWIPVSMIALPPWIFLRSTDWLTDWLVGVRVPYASCWVPSMVFTCSWAWSHVFFEVVCITRAKKFWTADGNKAKNGAQIDVGKYTHY